MFGNIVRFAVAGVFLEKCSKNITQGLLQKEATGSKTQMVGGLLQLAAACLIITGIDNK